jgi:hypothetical protein
MSENLSDDSILENLEPPEVKLTTPDLFETEQIWLVVARNRKINRNWEALLTRYPENCYRCYQFLSTTPTTRLQGRVFPLKGKPYTGAWEYELTGGDRVYYIPNEEQLKVIVYYAGKHPNIAPRP